MDIKKYEVLSKVVELSSLTKAAAEFGLTQSGVSHIIASLEKELGFGLLIRVRTGARLTEDGERIMPFIRELLSAEAKLNAAAEEIRGSVSGRICIGTISSVAVNWLPGIMKQFQLEHPMARFKLLNGDYHDVAEWLNEGEADIGFTALPLPKGCQCVELVKDRLLAVLPKGHPLSHGASCPVKAIADQPFISLLDASNDDARRVLEAAGVKPDVKFKTKDDYAIIAMVSQGLGISIMPELLLKGKSEGVELRPLDPPASRVIALAIPGSAGQSPATRRFAEFAANWVKRNCV